MSGIKTGNNIANSKVVSKKKEEATVESNKINKNVILTDFEKETVLSKLTTYDEEGIATRVFTKGDIYGMNKFERETDEGVEHIKFLSVAGRFENQAGFKLSVTIVVVEDKRFYMTLGNEEIKKKTGKDLFINHLPHMLLILDNITSGFLSEEQIVEEVNSINNFGMDI